MQFILKVTFNQGDEHSEEIAYFGPFDSTDEALKKESSEGFTREVLPLNPPARSYFMADPA